MAKLNLSKFSFSAEEIRDINSLVFDAMMEVPELRSIHTIFTGIRANKEIGFITGGGLVGKKGQGCDPSAHDFQIGTRKVTWKPVPWEVFIKECSKDLDNTAALYCRNTGTNIHDLTNTDYMAIVVQVLTESINNFFMRIVWLGDKDAANVSEGGQITDGVDTEYFDLLDGYFKQLQIAVTSKSELLVSIEANSKASKAAQMALSGDEAIDILEKMYFAAPIAMRASGKMRYLVTQSVADGYTKYLQGKNLESTYKNTVDGLPSLKYQGVDVIPMPIWDEMIQSYQDKGATYYKPHRAVLIEQSNLAIGLPTEEELENVDVWYDKTDRNNYLLAAGEIDAELLNDTRFVYAQ